MRRRLRRGLTFIGVARRRTKRERGQRRAPMCRRPDPAGSVGAGKVQRKRTRFAFGGEDPRGQARQSRSRHRGRAASRSSRARRRRRRRCLRIAWCTSPRRARRLSTRCGFARHRAGIRASRASSASTALRRRDSRSMPCAAAPATAGRAASGAGIDDARTTENARRPSRARGRAESPSTSVTRPSGRTPRRRRDDRKRHRSRRVGRQIDRNFGGRFARRRPRCQCAGAIPAGERQREAQLAAGEGFACAPAATRRGRRGCETSRAAPPPPCLRRERSIA